MYKEVRNFKGIGFRVPLAIVNKAHQANQLYPFAISLIESVRAYERTLDKVSVLSTSKHFQYFYIFFTKTSYANYLAKHFHDHPHIHVEVTFVSQCANRISFLISIFDKNVLLVLARGPYDIPSRHTYTP